MYTLMDRQVGKLMGGCMDGLMVRQVGGRMEGCMGGWMDYWMDGSVDRKEQMGRYKGGEEKEWKSRWRADGRINGDHILWALLTMCS